MTKSAGLLQVRLRLDFESGQSVGPGKIALLERIGVCGSLSQAARDLGLSYRRAWLLLDDLNQLFQDPVVTTLVGGRKGGGATLTAAGRKLIEEFHAIERAAGTASRRRFKGMPVASVRPRGKKLRQRLSRPLRSAGTSKR